MSIPSPLAASVGRQFYCGSDGIVRVGLNYRFY
jgi:hypothetical protein